VSFPALKVSDGDPNDPRLIGEALWPEEYPQHYLESLKEEDEHSFNALYQQDPAPAGGGFFHRDWWGEFTEMAGEKIFKATFMDCAEKPGLSNDFSVSATWTKTTMGNYCSHVWREKVGFPDLKRAAVRLFEEEKPDILVIEDKSAGTQLIQELKEFTGIPIFAYNPGSVSKDVRISSAAPTIQGGRCSLLKGAPWVKAFKDEHERGPYAATNDDQMDTTAMMVDYFRGVSATGPRIRSL
jgi:predicted phage terminase large subunit-like protein